MRVLCLTERENRDVTCRACDQFLFLVSTKIDKIRALVSVHSIIVIIVQLPAPFVGDRSTRYTGDGSVLSISCLGLLKSYYSGKRIVSRLKKEEQYGDINRKTHSQSWEGTRV